MSIKNVGFLDKKYYIFGHEVYGAGIAENELFENIIKNKNIEKIKIINTAQTFYESVNKRFLNQQSYDTSKVEFIDKQDLFYKQNKIDIDILHDTAYDFLKNIIFRELYTKNKPPYTYTMHCASMPNFIYDTYFIQLFSSFRPYDSLICTSNSLKKVITNYFEILSEKLYEKYNIKINYNGQMNVIPLGVDTSKFKPLDKNDCRDKMSIRKDAFVILYYGRISAISKADILPLITVIKRLTDKNNKFICLYICGYDEQSPININAIKNKIKSLHLEENVFFLDNNIDKSIMYNMSDCFVSPIDNIQETFGITPIEAMACGIPQIVSDWDGYRDTVVDGKTGFRIPSYWCKCDEDISCYPFLEDHGLGNPMSISHYSLAESVALDLDLMEKSFQILINNKNLRIKMSYESRNRAVEHYDWLVIINKYIDLWEDLIYTKKKYSDNKDSSNLIFKNDYYKAFSHYATVTLDLKSVLEITKEGIEILNGSKEWIKIYKWQDQILHLDICKNILNMLKLSPNTICSFKILNKNYDAVYRSAMYLLKHGYVRIKELRSIGKCNM